jgi:hypothetical protein
VKTIMVERLGRLLSTSTPASKASLLSALRGLLVECMTLRRVGGTHSRLAYAQGYADGMMRCLLDAKLMTQSELLAYVAEVRRGVDGPGSRQLAGDAGALVEGELAASGT